VKSKVSKPLLATHNAVVAYSFILPNFLGFTIFTLVPVAISIYISFTNWSIKAGSGKWIGIDNYVALFKSLGTLSGTFGPALQNTIVFTVLSVPITMVCALGLAMLLNSNIRGRNVFRTIAFFPYIASLIAVAYVFKALFVPTETGVINAVLKQMFDVTIRWQTHQWGIYFMVILFSVWKNMGYYMVIYLAGLQGVNQELLESAALDGANKWQKFWNVTLPQIAPTNFFVMIMLVVSSFKVYDVFFQLFSDDKGNLTQMTTVLVQEIYMTGLKGNFQYGKSSAISMVLFVLVLVVTLVQFRFEKKLTYD
jgi:multiple sugar transport system permease protein